MTTGAAVSFAIEALRLRSEMYESEVRTIRLLAVVVEGLGFGFDPLPLKHCACAARCMRAR